MFFSLSADVLFKFKLFFGFLLSFLITLYTIPLCIALAYRTGLLDRPDGVLKTHRKAVPYLGGVAIYLGFISSLALVFPFENKVLLLFIGTTLLLLLGLIDDIAPLAPYQKFFGQMVAAFCFLKTGFYLKEQFFSNLINIGVSYIWILVVVNAINLVDVMDGLATTIACMATSTFLVIALLLGQGVVALLLTCFLGALVAFLYFNKPPAQIYLGDAGSLFIGGWLATFPFMIPWATHTFYGFITPIVITLIPLLEVATLIIIRSYKKIPFYRGSPHHFCLFLMNRGWKKETILSYVVVLSILLFTLSILFVLGYINLIIVSLCLMVFIFFWYLILISYL